MATVEVIAMKYLKIPYLFLYYYFYALREPVHDTKIRSIKLAWRLSRIAA